MSKQLDMQVVSRSDLYQTSSPHVTHFHSSLFTTSTPTYYLSAKQIHLLQSLIFMLEWPLKSRTKVKTSDVSTFYSFCMFSELTIDNLKTEMKLTDEQLNTAIKEPDLPELAACFDNVHNGYLERLELLPGEQTDVKTRAYVDGTLAGMLLALKLWRLTKGLEATFRALLFILLSLLKENVAVQVCKYLSDKCESV